MNLEQWSYNTLGVEQTQAVVEAYERVQSCSEASKQEGVFVSSATVSRVVNAAVVLGLLDGNIKRSAGRPRGKRERAKEVLKKFPHDGGKGYERKQQANIAECSESTIYEALKEV